jgi:hypothetical protein
VAEAEAEAFFLAEMEEGEGWFLRPCREWTRFDFAVAFGSIATQKAFSFGRSFQVLVPFSFLDRPQRCLCSVQKKELQKENKHYWA